MTTPIVTEPTVARVEGAPQTRGDCLTSAQRFRLAVVNRGPLDPMPKIRGYGPDGPEDGEPDGFNAERPCPFVACRWHLGAEYDAQSGEVVPALRVAEEATEEERAATDEALLAALELGARIIAEGKVQEYRAGLLDPAEYPPGALVETCALDFADAVAVSGATGTLESIGVAMERTRERVRQIIEGGLRRARQGADPETLEALREQLRIVSDRQPSPLALADG